MPRSASHRNLVLGLMLLVYAVHMMDRSILQVLLEPIRHEFDLNDSELGLLSGLGYAVPFALAGIPLGMLVDRVNRRTFLALAVTIWSLATATSGLAQGFGLLILARAVIGTAEAGGPPAMLSILSDTFPPRSRATAINILYVGTFIGVIAGSLIGGYAAARVGWRGAFFTAAIPGLVLSAALALTLREPERINAVEPAEPLGKVIRLILQAPRLRVTICAMVLASLLPISIASWTPVLLGRSHGLAAAAVGQYTALAIGLPSGLGLLLGGLLSARYAKGRSDRLLRQAGISVALMVPSGIAGALSPSLWGAVICFALSSLAAGVYIGPGYSLCLGWVPPRSRGTVMAIIVVAANLCGAGLGPQLVGLMSDFFHWAGDSRSLDHALAGVVLIGIVPTILFFIANNSPHEEAVSG